MTSFNSAAKRPLAAVAGLLAVLLACSPNDESERQHPTPQNLRASEVSHSHALDLASSSLSELLSVHNEGFSAAAGTIDLPPADFMDFRSAALLPRGGVAVLDARLNVIRIFDNDGAYVDSLSGPGIGADRLRYPTDIAVSEHGAIWALDIARVAKHFTLSDHGSYEFAGSIELKHRAESLCVLGSNVFVRGRDDATETLIHVYGATGNDKGSFAEAYQDSVALVRDQLSRGIIGCDPTSGLIILAYDHLPILRAFDQSGNHEWSVRIPIEPIETTSTDGAQPSVTRHGSRPFDEVVSLNPIGSALMIVEIRRTTVHSRLDRQYTFRRLLLDTRTGDVSPMQTDSLSYFLAIDAGRYVSSRPTPGESVQITNYGEPNA